MKANDIDWSQSRIIFVSQSFNNYQKDSVNFKDLPFELWEIARYSNDQISLNKHVSTSTESVKTISAANSKNFKAVTDEIKSLRETILNLRAALDEKDHEKNVAVQKVTQGLSGEIVQLKKTVSSLRNELEIHKADARDEVQRIKVENKREIEVLQGTISNLRQKYEEQSTS